MNLKVAMLDRYEAALTKAAVLEERCMRGNRSESALIAEVVSLKKEVADVVARAKELPDLVLQLNGLYEAAQVLSAAVHLQERHNTKERRLAVRNARTALCQAMAKVNLDFVIPF